MGSAIMGNFDLRQVRLNSSQNLLQTVSGITSFTIPTIPGVDPTLFYLAGIEGFTSLYLLNSGDELDPRQQVADTSASKLEGLADLQFFREGGKNYLIGVARNDFALNVYTVSANTGAMTFTSAVTDSTSLNGARHLSRLQIGGEDFVATVDLNESLSIWALSNKGKLTQVDRLTDGFGRPLTGVTDVVSFGNGGGSIDGLVTVSAAEGLGLWEVSAAGKLELLDTFALPSAEAVAAIGGTIIAAKSSDKTLNVFRTSGGTLTQDSSFSLQDAGFTGTATVVHAFEVENQTIVGVVTSAGEILLFTLSWISNTYSLHLAQSWSWADDPTAPIRNARDFEFVTTFGNAFIAIAGTQPQSEADLEGVSLFSIGLAPEELTGTGSNDTIFGFGGSDTLKGGGGADQIYGGDFLDRMYGGTGKDHLYGGYYRDKIYGGSGKDTVYGGHGADTMNGGTGIDRLDYSDAGGKVNINLTTNATSGSGAAGDVISNFEQILGSRYDDELVGNAQANYIDGDDGNDSIDGGAGNDELNAGGGDDTVSGDDGDDNIRAQSGRNLLVGGKGNDTIYFGMGDDVALGGAGNDVFVWLPTAAELAQIRFFTQGADKIDLSAINPNFITPETVFDMMENIGGVSALLKVNGDRGIIIRQILVEELTLDDFIF